MMKINELYKGFKVLAVIDVTEYNSTGIWLRHEKSGLEVFHLLNEDVENLFAFAFRTPSANSTGVAHVLEHSVLCGSRKYPVKDPFLRLTNQSVNTYLNAYTASDHTVFPASSIVKADFYNLFSVYADAVFFPLLQKEVFMQECHRLELGENGIPSIQGVVYNEMKGAYSSFERLASDEIEKVMLSGTHYAHDSGGDPLEIPSLTYKDFKSFHKKYYCTSNCLVFLYGNIPTEEHLDFLEKNILQNISNYGKKAKYPLADKAVKIKSKVHSLGPAQESSQESSNVVSLAWKLSDGIEKENRAEFNMLLMFLDFLLWGDDSSVVSRELLLSGFGKDIAPQTGINLSSRYPSTCFAMHGVKKEDEQKFKNAIMNAIRNVCKNGFSSEDLDRVEFSFDISNREIKRPGGSPFSMVLLRKTLGGWLYGFNPWEGLFPRGEFNRLQQKIKENPGYLSQMIKKYFLDNKNISLISIEPSVKWSENRSGKEEKIARTMLKALGEKKVLSNLKLLNLFQNKEEDDSIVPSLDVKDLTSDIEQIKITKTKINDVPLYLSKENTNGILYFDLGFPVDVLKAEDYPYLPFLAGCFADVGWKDLSWDKAIKKIGLVSGGFNAYMRSVAVPDCEKDSIDEKSYIGRDWLMINFETLEEKVPDAFNILSDCIQGTDFSDTSRLQDLVSCYLNEIKYSAVAQAHSYAVSRVQRNINRTTSVNELWDGISSVFFGMNYAKMDINEISKKICSLYKKIISSGAVMHITGTSEGIAIAKKCLPEFVKRNNLCYPVQKRNQPDSVFYKLTNKLVYGNDKADKKEYFSIPGMVGYAARYFASSSFGSKESVADSVYSHCLSTTDLWKKIRMVGGAYGVYLSTNSLNNVTRFLTYRDPKPFDSLGLIKKVIAESENKNFSVEEVEKSITGSYSDEINPMTPASRGTTGFFWELSGMKNSYRIKRVKNLLSLKPSDIQKAAKRFSENIKANENEVVVCSKEIVPKEIIGNLVKLPI